MDRGKWYDVSEFPDPGDYESTVEFGDAVYQSIIDRFKWNHGGEIPEPFEREAHTFGRVWAYAESEQKLLITENDIDFFTEMVTDAESDLGFKRNASNVISRMSGRGFVPVQPDRVLEDVEWADSEEALVRSSVIPDLPELRSKILDGRVLPREAIIHYASGLVRQHFDNNGINEEPTATAIGITTAIESRLDRHDWFHLPIDDGEDRIWVEPEGIFSKLVPDEDEVEELSEDEIKNILLEYLNEIGVGQYIAGNLSLAKLLNDFQVKLRSRGWGEVINQGTSTWYTSERAHKEALEALHELYKPIWDTPNPRYRSVDEMVATLKETFRFYSHNSRPLKDFQLVRQAKFSDKLNRLAGYREVAEGWNRLDGSETAGGEWTVEFSGEGPGIIDIDVD